MPGLELITVSSYVLSLTYDKLRGGAERDIFQYITPSSLPSPFPITGGRINDTRIPPSTPQQQRHGGTVARYNPAATASALLKDFCRN